MDTGWRVNMINNLKRKIILIVTLSLSVIMIGVTVFFAVNSYRETVNQAGIMVDRFIGDKGPDNNDNRMPIEENAENATRTADALRTALAAFRPQLQRMSPQDRQRFNADVAARMRKLTARSGKDRNPYAAIRGASARSRDDRALGQRIMAARNVNRRH